MKKPEPRKFLSLEEMVTQFRERLDKCFSKETQVPNTVSDIPSAGHCAAVAYWVWLIWGGEMLSTKINNISHWFNKIEGKYIDLTGDQFGYSKVQISTTPLYSEFKVREFEELNQETLARATKLWQNYCKVIQESK